MTVQNKHVLSHTLYKYCVCFQGFEILEELEDAVGAKKPQNTLQMLSSKFYTAIPHDFGRRTPPVINTTEGVQKKYDMLAVRVRCVQNCILWLISGRVVSLGSLVPISLPSIIRSCCKLDFMTSTIVSIRLIFLCAYFLTESYFYLFSFCV